MSARYPLVIAVVVAVFNTPVNADAQLPIKMDYAEGVIMKSSNAQRVEASNNDAAKNKLQDARDKFGRARAAQQSGDFPLADQLTNEALRLVTAAAQLVPNLEDQSEKSKKRYQELVAQINTYQSWKKDYAGSDEESQEARDMAKVKSQIEKASILAETGKHSDANELLQNVLGIVVMYANSSLKSRTFTYDINFETPIDEYKYEDLRNKDYLRLIPIAIAQKSPSAGVLSLMNRFSAKSEQLRHDAEELYAAKQYEEAVAKMKESTEQLITSLKMTGVR